MTRKKKILVVDDEQDLCDILLFNLTMAGYDAEAANTAEEALGMIVRAEDAGEGHDLLLLDVMMPGMDGFELVRLLRLRQPAARRPIIFITAKDTEDDTLRGFHLGADDYVKKPFSVREVMARVAAVLSRSNAATPHPAILCHDGLSVDLERKRVTVDGEEAPLTRTEFELLALLMAHSTQVLTRQQLLEGAWPTDVVVTDRSVDVCIARLRKKLGRYAACIVSRQGFGYCFED